MEQIFGLKADVTPLKIAWQSNNFTDLPKIVIVSATQLNGARGAYVESNDTIYLSGDYIFQNLENLEPVVTLLLEEIGHGADARLNEIDTSGDEGAFFASVVQAEELTETELEQLAREDDSIVFSIDSENQLQGEANTPIIISGLIEWEDVYSSSSLL